MADILKEILKKVPRDKISDAGFEAANIVLYTKDKDFFLDNKGIIKEAVDEFKKRIELRPDPAATMEMEEAKKIIKKLIPKEAGVQEIIFDSQRSMVIIHVDKPGLAIGKQGSTLRDIRKDTMWVPLIKRMPPIRSKLIESIRSVLYENSDYRRKFLNKVGHRIYDGWIREKKSEWIRLSFLGGGRQVGRSALFLQTPESRILLDCGIDVGAANKEDTYPLLESPEFKIEDLDAVIVSHSHIDHSGLIPYLFKYGYRGPIYCTLPTRDVMALLQLDTVKIQKSEGQEPIYTSEEIKQMVLHTIPVEWEAVTDITPDVRLTLYNAGHILGSSMIHLNIGNGLHNLLYTGDLKVLRTNLLEGAESSFPRLETAIIESTYGGKDDFSQSPAESDKNIIELITQTIDRGGKVLIPVLGSGRAQEVMVIIERLVREGKLPKVPVYVDGMVWDITAIHTAYPEFLNRNLRKLIFHKDTNPFMSDMFIEVGSQKERKKILEEEGPCVILATSGMLVGGPSVEYLKGLCEGKKNSLIFSSYQGENSLGRRILNGEKEIMFKIEGKPSVFKINMEVSRIVVTGHADRKELMSFIGKCNPRPKRVIVQHGENMKCLDLASSLHKMYRIETLAPKNLETVRIR